MTTDWKAERPADWQNDKPSRYLRTDKTNGKWKGFNLFIERE